MCTQCSGANPQRRLATIDGNPQLPGLLQRFEQALTSAEQCGADRPTSEPISESSSRAPQDDPLLVDRLRVPVGGVGRGDLYPSGGAWS